MGIDKIQKAARSLHTHTVVFKTGSDEDHAVRYAMCGQTTKAIAAKTGLTEAQVQYRLTKAKVKRTGKDGFRNGTNPFAVKVLNYGFKLAKSVVADEIAPRFAGVGATRINQ